jgi:acyl-CoA thioesterase II
LPRNVVELVKLLAVKDDGGDLYTGIQPGDGRLARVFGGQVAAQALQAAVRTVAPKRLVHSLHAYFVRGGNPEMPIQFEVFRVRDGGSFTTRRVAAVQDGVEIFHLMASFHGVEHGFSHSARPQSLEDPEGLPTVVEMLAQRGGVDAEFWSREWQALDMRCGSAGPRAGSPSGQQIWFKVREPLEGPQSLHRSVLTYMSDLTLLSASIAPHGYFIGSSEVQRASLDHAVWFHSDIRADDWLLYDQVSPWAGGGRGFARAEIYDRNGRMVATVVQEGLVRPRDRGTDRLIRTP